MDLLTLASYVHASGVPALTSHMRAPCPSVLAMGIRWDRGFEGVLCVLATGACLGPTWGVRCCEAYLLFCSMRMGYSSRIRACVLTR